MTAISRRGFMAGAVLASTGIASLSTMATIRPAPAGPTLLYDGGLAAGARFAAQARALGGTAHRLAGDRARQLYALLSKRPRAVFGVTGHGDEWLASRIARGAGYRRVSLIEHRAGGATVPIHAPDGATIATLARLAGGRWPEAFAELAIGGIEQRENGAAAGLAEPAFSWVLARVRAG